MDSISVLFLSRVTLLPGVELRPHIHDYWHFAVSMKGEIRGKDGKRGYAPACSCIAPGIPHADCVCVEELHSINAMFLVIYKKKARCKNLAFSLFFVNYCYQLSTYYHFGFAIEYVHVLVRDRVIKLGVHTGSVVRLNLKDRLILTHIYVYVSVITEKLGKLNL